MNRLERWALGCLVEVYVASLGGRLVASPAGTEVLCGKTVTYSVCRSLAILDTILAVGAVISSVLAWRWGFRSLAWRIHYTLVTLAAVSVVWFYFNWKILG